MQGESVSGALGAITKIACANVPSDVPENRPISDQVVNSGLPATSGALSQL